MIGQGVTVVELHKEEKEAEKGLTYTVGFGLPGDVFVGAFGTGYLIHTDRRLSEVLYLTTHSLSTFQRAFPFLVSLGGGIGFNRFKIFEGFGFITLGIDYYLLPEESIGLHVGLIITP